MPITCIAQNRVLSAAISGEIDQHSAKEMMSTLDRQIDIVLPRSLTLDFGGVTFMDSSGIALLLRAYRRMLELGGTLAVEHVSSQPSKVLRCAGVDRFIKFE
ncbi:MAG: sulfate transporter [Oscillospiraceae bacterium]|nr:sulfate transporter [Oscillospiraceae bacterium]